MNTGNFESASTGNIDFRVRFEIESGTTFTMSLSRPNGTTIEQLLKEMQAAAIVELSPNGWARHKTSGPLVTGSVYVLQGYDKNEIYDRIMH